MIIVKMPNTKLDNLREEIISVKKALELDIPPASREHYMFNKGKEIMAHHFFEAVDGFLGDEWTMKKADRIKWEKLREVLK